jgi:hypothetical protein
MSGNPSEKNVIGNIVFENIKRSIDSLTYGSVMVKVHAGRVVSVEVTEKRRFDDLWQLEGGDGI